MKSNYAGAVLAISVAVLSSSSTRAAQAAPVEPQCQIGAYRSTSGELLAITLSPQGGMRHTFVDGRRGLLSDQDSPVSCAGDVLTVRHPARGVERWPRVPFRITPTRFTSAGVTLAGMLIEPPQSRAKPPLVVMAHGSENSSWLKGGHSASYLYAAQGISTFIFDKHGTGSSEGKFHMNFQRLAKDLVAASAEARRLAKGRFSRFGLHGGSQGGWTVPLAAKAARAEFVVVSFGGLFSPQEEDSEQVLDELREKGASDEVLAKARTVTDATGAVQASAFNEGYEELAHVKRLYGREPWFAQLEGEYTGDILKASEDDLRTRKNELEIPWQHDAVKVVRENLSVPTLWVLAEKDREAPGGITEERLKMLIEEGKPIQVVMFPDTDHGMMEFVQKPDGSREYTRITEGYFRLVADWKKGRLSPPYGRAKFWNAPLSSSAKRATRR